MILKIFVKAKLKAKEECVKKIDETHFEVFVKEPPIEGRANRAIIETLAEFLNLPKSSLQIISGLTSKQKMIQIQNPNIKNLVGQIKI
ncbi:MAG: DUF167 domain-containing protein [Chlamydiae bacterium]|nr:DUF167 domain-containing protein [Chlamydiota bacterium]MBI3277034.1 DUF167 domain-containing protein [Chlamydiota bacterium]